MAGGASAAKSAERADAIDNLLWTYDDQSFLPHAQRAMAIAARQPVLITVEDVNPNAANVLFLVGGAAPPAWDAPNDLTRIVLMFDGRDPAIARRRARVVEGRRRPPVTT